MWKPISSCSIKNLSRASKEVTIKSVLQYIVAYVMSIFLLPPSFGDVIEKKMTNSIWCDHGGSNTHETHSLPWDKFSNKKMGGKRLQEYTYLQHFHVS